MIYHDWRQPWTHEQLGQYPKAAVRLLNAGQDMREALHLILRTTKDAGAREEAARVLAVADAAARIDGVGEFASGLGKGCKAQSSLKPDADGVAEVRYLIEGKWPPFWIKDADAGVMFNGLTEAETNETASVRGIVGVQAVSVPADPQRNEGGA